ncbi:MAG: DUF58 domain-containing protein [Verrucomicrobiae bacterium]|nr:DUF58 domain-containing protein [Verrucomicrobiae bacterium]
MTPNRRLLLLAACWVFGGVLAIALPAALPAWKLAGLGLLAVVLADAVIVRFAAAPVVTRRLPERFAQGVDSDVRLQITNRSRLPARCEVFDGIPQGAKAETLPCACELEPSRNVRIEHPVSMDQRGEAVFGQVEILRESPLGLWQRKTRHLGEERVKVYPNYEPVIRFALLALQHRESPMGIVRRPRAGTSRDFHQLRDYRDGDPFTQIDWKASSRRQVLISRDYQEQRDQSVVFLIDTGRRMRALDHGVPQLDHVLNAVLLVSHVALRQGDHLAVKSFGGTDRWLPPVKGAHAMPVLLNHLYDYQATPEPSDFAAAVERLMALQRRRSLVIVVTNLRGEDGNELLPSLQVLSTRHLVLLASMREGDVQEALRKPVESLRGALRYLAAGRYDQERREILAALGASGILTLDSTAAEFPIALANRYLDVKAAGRL